MGGYTDDISLQYSGPLPVLLFGDHTRRVKYVDRSFVVGAEGIKILHPRDCLAPRFAYYHLNAMPVSDRGYGRHFAILRSHNFHIPPQPEQRRIVEAIEALFSRLDAADSSLRNAQVRLARLRATALEQIVLTQAPRAFIADILQRNRKAAYGVLQPGRHVPEGVPLVRVSDVQDGQVRIDGLKHVSPGVAAQYPRTRLTGGEVLVTIVGTIGRAAVVPTSLAGGNVARAVAVLPVNDRVVPEFLALFLNAPSIRLSLNNLAHEVARKTLNLEDVRRISFPLPDLSRQHALVDMISARISAYNAAVADVDHTVRRSASLRTTVLDAAFAGRLVGQGPRDEPVSLPAVPINGDARSGTRGARRQTLTASQAVSSLE